MLPPNCSTLLNPTRDPPVSLVPACSCHTAHHSTAQPCCHRAPAAGMAETQGGDCHLPRPGSRAGSLCATTLSCHCHPCPLPGSPKIGCLKIGSLLPLQLQAKKSYGVGWTQCTAALSTASENNSIAVIARKAGLTVAHANRESLLKLAWCLQAGHRPTAVWAGQTSWQALAPGTCTRNTRGNLTPHSWPWAEGSSISTLSSCTQSIVSFPVCLIDSEQKGCLVLGAICIMFRQQWCIVSPWCLCSAPS